VTQKVPRPVGEPKGKLEKESSFEFEVGTGKENRELAKNGASKESKGFRGQWASDEEPGESRESNGMSGESGGVSEESEEPRDTEEIGEGGNQSEVLEEPENKTTTGEFGNPGGSVRARGQER
jgi:hypothetical protein